MLSAVLAFVTVNLTAQDPLILSCQSFPPNTTASDLAARFGADNVSNGEVHIGEGFYESGTIVFADIPDKRAEYLWEEPNPSRTLKSIRISGEKSRWRTPQGLTLGLSLSMVERLNRRPFRLLGLGWDYGGTSMTWSGGVLAQAELAPCRVWVRFWQEEDRLTPAEGRLSGQVSGGREFSSGHPGMQAAHAYVHMMGLSFRK